MTSRQKAKGSSFEKQIADFLNEQYGTTEFHRTPGSGAFMGRSNFQKKSGLSEAVMTTLVGDLMTPKDYPFVIECKSYKDKPSFFAMLTPDGDATLNKWLDEVETDAENSGKLPILFFKITNKGTYYVIPELVATWAGMMSEGRGIPFACVSYTSYQRMFKIDDGEITNRSYRIYSIKHFPEQKDVMIYAAKEYVLKDIKFLKQRDVDHSVTTEPEQVT